MTDHSLSRRTFWIFVFVCLFDWLRNITVVKSLWKTVCVLCLECLCLLSRICLRWMWSLTDSVVWTWLASGSSTLRIAKWPPSSRNGPWSGCRPPRNLTLVYWTASWPWVSLTNEWRNESLCPSFSQSAALYFKLFVPVLDVYLLSKLTVTDNMFIEESSCSSCSFQLLKANPCVLKCAMYVHISWVFRNSCFHTQIETQTGCLTAQ